MKKIGLLLNKLDKWDKSCILRYNGFGGKLITKLLKVISFLGRESIWLSLIVYFLFIWYDRVLFSFIASIFLIGVIIIAPMKKFLERSRPFEELEEITILDRKPSSRSFPSWHAYNVVSQGLFFTVLFNNFWLSLLIITIAALVCFSRIQLGVHYPSDVIFGSIIGIFGFFISFYILSPFSQQILIFFEQFIPLEIQYQKLNALLCENILYLLLIIGLFVVIFLLAIKNKIKLLFTKFR